MYLLCGFTLIGVIQCAISASPAPEEGAGGGVAVFLVEEGGGGFLAQGLGGGEVCD